MLRGAVRVSVDHLEGDRHSSIITSIEELGIQKGIEQGRAEGRVAGLLDGIALVLELKFGDVAAPLITELRQLTDLALLDAILAQLKTAATTSATAH